MGTYGKCGEILINLKTKNKKTKIYQFNCAFCNVNCEQLKKFSQHLVKKHLHEFADEPADKTVLYDLKPNPELTDDESDDKPNVYEPDIKIEELIKDTADDLKKKLRKRKSEDPLKTCVTSTTPTVSCADELIENIKNENEDVVYEECSTSNWEMFEDEDAVDAEIADKKAIQEKKDKFVLLSHCKRKNDLDLDEDLCTDDSRDEDFNIDEELNNLKRERFPTKRKKIPIKQETESDCHEIPTTIDEKELSIALLEAFEKQTNLWDVKKRTFVREAIQKSYEIIAKEVNEKLKSNIKWELARRNIRQMRYDYSVELEKQRKGQQFQMPWYMEHMKYLQENVDVLLKGRYEVSKYKALKTMDETELSILIELYKKYEILWQVNNIAYGIRSKKDEIFDKIREELQQNYKLNITAENLHRRVNYMHRLYSKDKARELKCQHEFIPSSPLYKQMAFLSESQGPFKCPECNVIVDSYKNYQMHVGKHKDGKPFKCPLCAMGFKKFSQYLTHTKRHLGIHNYNCTVCGKGYPFRAELEFHLRSHTGNKPFLCQICGVSFKNRQAHDNHIRRHEKRFRFECHICKRGFNQSHLLRAHVKMHLNIRDFVCSTCGKGFTTKYHLKRHELKHEPAT